MNTEHAAIVGIRKDPQLDKECFSNAVILLTIRVGRSRDWTPLRGETHCTQEAARLRQGVFGKERGEASR